jgi:hypothetical protein
MPANVLPSITRSLVPIVVGYLLGWPVVRVLNLGEEQVTSLVTVVVIALYYLAVRALEQYVPAAGWLLGYASTPTYAPAQTPGSTLSNGRHDAGQVGLDLILLVVLVIECTLLLFGVSFK